MATLGYNQNNSILGIKKTDVTGDGMIDEIYLTGYKRKPEDILVKNIDLVVEEGKSKQITRAALPSNEGVNPRLFTGDFNCDGTADVLVSIDADSSGRFGYFFLYSYKNNRLLLFFDREKLDQERSDEVVF